MYHNIILEGKEIHERFNKFMGILEKTDYIGFYPDVEGDRVVVFFRNEDEVMRGYEILNEDFHVQFGIPTKDVDRRWIWNE